MPSAPGGRDQSDHPAAVSRSIGRDCGLSCSRQSVGGVEALHLEEAIAELDALCREDTDAVSALVQR